MRAVPHLRLIDSRTFSSGVVLLTYAPDPEVPTNLLVSGLTLSAIRPDGTGRTEIRPVGLPYPAGGIPDWTR